MRLQQWGAFSVKDHVKPRAFVAEVLLFDKLVIPRPATGEELYAEGQVEPGEDQKDRWILHAWNPDRQRELLDILGEFDFGVELPWGNRAEQDWQAIYNKPASEQLECDRSDLTQSIQYQVDLAKSQIPEAAAYLATASVLDLYVAGKMRNNVARKLLTRARTPGVPVEPVNAYGSYAEFSTDQGVRTAEALQDCYGTLLVRKEPSLADSLGCRTFAEIGNFQALVETVEPKGSGPPGERPASRSKFPPEVFDQFVRCGYGRSITANDQARLQDPAHSRCGAARAARGIADRVGESCLCF